MRALRVFWLVVVFLALHPRVGKSESLEAMDAVLQESGTLQNFLSNKNAREKYFKAAQQYYGKERFPERSYEAILKDLEATLKAVPEIESRLWKEIQNPTQFEFRTGAKSFGRLVQTQMWEGKLKELTQNLEAKSKKLLELDEPNRNRLIQQRLVSVKTKIDDANAIIATTPRSQRAKVRSDLFQNIYAPSDIQEVESYVALTTLRAEATQEILRSGDADLVLTTWNRMLQAPAKLSSDLPIEIRALADLTLTQTSRQLPSFNSLLADENLFSKVMKETRAGNKVWVGESRDSMIVMREPPRLFHTIFKGIPGQECVGGASLEDGEGLKSITPERYLTALLNGSKILFGERSAAHSGYVEMNPVQIKDHLVASSHFFLPVLAQSALTEIEGKEFGIPVYERFIRELNKHRPEGTEGLSLSQSNSFNNAGVTPSAHVSPSYISGKTLGLSDEASLTDPLAEKITAFAKDRNQGFAKMYAGRMIVDALVPDARQLVLLNTEAPLLFSAAGEIQTALDSNDKRAVQSMVLAIATRPEILTRFDPASLRTPKNLEVFFKHAAEPGEKENKKYQARLPDVYRAILAIGHLYKGSPELPKDLLERLQYGWSGRKFEYTDWTQNAMAAARRLIWADRPELPLLLWENLFEPSFDHYEKAESQRRADLIAVLQLRPGTPQSLETKTKMIEFAGPMYDRMTLDDRMKERVEDPSTENPKFREDKRNAKDTLLMLFDLGSNDPRVREFGLSVAEGHALQQSQLEARPSNFYLYTYIPMQARAAAAAQRLGYDIHPFLIAIAARLTSELEELSSAPFSDESQIKALTGFLWKDTAKFLDAQLPTDPVAASVIAESLLKASSLVPAEDKQSVLAIASKIAPAQTQAFIQAQESPQKPKGIFKSALQHFAQACSWLLRR